MKDIKKQIQTMIHISITQKKVVASIVLILFLSFSFWLLSRYPDLLYEAKRAQGGTLLERNLGSITKIEDEMHPDFSYDTGCKSWGESTTQIEICFRLLKVLKKEGVEASIKLFANLYNTDQGFEVGDCHIYAHSLGRAAYREFGEQALPVDMFLTIPNMAARCAIKSYHGFFQEFFIDNTHSKEALDTARVYCDGLKRREDKFLFRSERPGHCIIGVAYGVLYSYATQYGYREEEAVNAALADCAIFRETKFDYNSCILGVYEGASMLYLGLSSDEFSWAPPEDPFLLCRDQDIRSLKEICFIGLRSFAWITMPDLQKVMEFLEGTEDGLSKIMAEEFSLGASAFFMRDEDIDNAKMLAECRRLNDEFQEICVGAFAFRVAKFRSVEDAVAFCRQESILGEDRDYCFGKVLDSLERNYTQEDRDRICVLLEESYGLDCLDI